MAENDPKPTEASIAKSAASPAPTTRKPAAAKPAARSRKPAAAVPANRRKAPVKAATAKKSVPRTAATRKTPTVKKSATKLAPLAAEAGKPVKVKKPKLVRDSFTMPESEYILIAALKKRCLAAGVPAKKSEILRAAVANLAKLRDASVVSALRRLDVIKTGRPAKGNK